MRVIAPCMLKQLLGFSIFIYVCIQGCTPAEPNQQLSESPIEISWELLSNIEPENKFSAVLTFTNTSDKSFPPSGWTLYFNSIRPLDAQSFLPEFELVHLNGDFFKLIPTATFEAIESGKTYQKSYLSGFHAIKKSDAPQGFYFVFDDGHIETVPEMAITPFTKKEQVNRSETDLINVPSSQSIYTENESQTLLLPETISPITPLPKEYSAQDGYFTLDEQLSLYAGEGLQNEMELLSDFLQQQYSVSLEKTESASNLQNGIHLRVDTTLTKEGYHLEISEQTISILGGSDAGVFYGIQSLQALINNRMENKSIPGFSITDEPAFEYRGMHLDVARNFQSSESVKTLLDVMSMYKLNRFHFHLTDDEGWRLAIDALPELTEIGGRRGHTETESDRLFPSYGSGPNPTPENSFGSGWYSRQDYIEILRFAAHRHIEVIPEIDVPGHARAAIVAMKNRAERLHAEGDSDSAEMYRLDEPEDLSEYQSVQFFNDNVINVCRESVYNFLELVVDEIIDMHSEAGVPLTTIHAGGDEVPQGVWEKSPLCKQLMDKQGVLNVRDLQTYFFNRFETILSQRGLKMAGWEEVAFLEDEGKHVPNPQFTDTVIPHVWSNIWGSGTEEYAYELANYGYKVIMSHASNFYFDFAYNKKWDEPGFYWAAMFNTKGPYSFIPFDLYKNAEMDNYGNPISENHFDDAIQLTEYGKSNIYGIQGQLWTETVNKIGRMEYMIFPRLLGLAERAWVGNPEWANHNNRNTIIENRDETWNEFANRLGQFELNHLDKRHNALHYRIPSPGAEVRNGLLYVNSIFPGMDIRYELGPEPPTMNSVKFNAPVDVSDAKEVTIAVFNSVGRSGKPTTIHLN